MAKPTILNNLLKQYKDRGYTVRDGIFICPDCAAKIKTLKGKNVASTRPNLYNNYVRNVRVFDKPGVPSVAACYKCGFRRASNKAKEVEVSAARCQGTNKNGQPCKNPPKDNGYCGVHQNQAPAYEGQARAVRFLCRQDNVRVSAGI